MTSNFGSDGSWVDTEFSTIALGDRRLNDRAGKILLSLSNRPQTKIPDACKGWNETHSAYRFFSNQKVTAEQILAPHIEASLLRASQFKVVLAVQDSTSLNFTGLKSTSGLGNIGDSANNGHAKGLINHNTYLVSDCGVPLGLMDQEIWARDVSKCKNPAVCIETPIHQKESIKWIAALQRASRLTSSLNNTCVIHVGDREADIYELFDEAKACDQKFIIRVQHNRIINKKSKHSNDGEKLLERLAKEKPLAREEVEIKDRKSPDHTRAALFEFRTLSFTLTIPRIKSSKCHSVHAEKLQLTVVSATEVQQDDETDPINWVLLTNVDVNCAEQVQYCVQCYARRWSIEVFHRILKTGCRVESVRFNASDKIKIYAAFLGIVAWHIHWLTLYAREHSQEKADVIFTQNDQEILRKISKKPTPGRRKQLTIIDCVIYIAKLGGFLARKSDGFPGAEVLWRGLTRFADLKQSLKQLSCNGHMSYV